MDLYETEQGLELDDLLRQAEAQYGNSQEVARVFKVWLRRNDFHPSSPGYKAIFTPSNLIEKAYQIYVVAYWVKAEGADWVHPALVTIKKESHVLAALDSAIHYMSRKLVDFELYGGAHGRVKALAKHMALALSDHWNLWQWRNKDEYERRGAIKPSQSKGRGLSLSEAQVSDYLFNHGQGYAFQTLEWRDKNKNRYPDIAPLPGSFFTVELFKLTSNYA